MSNILATRLRAEAGDPRAQVELARALLVGHRAPQALDEAIRWISAACEQNNPDAFLLHAVLATLGLGRPTDIDEAYNFVSRAAALGVVGAKRQLEILGELEGFDKAVWDAAPTVEAHFSAPRVFTIPDFIPKRVCKWLINRVRNRLGKATLYANATAPEVSAMRTSSSYGFPPLEPDLVLQLVNLRISRLTGVPVSHQEATSILRYERGQEYVNHYDFFAEHIPAQAKEIEQNGQRIGTVLIYLNENYEDGETDFPLLNWRFKGKIGDALLFWNVSAEGRPERNSAHAGLRVTKGEKWLLTKWMRARPVPLF